MMDDIINAVLATSPMPSNWYSRDYTWFESILYQIEPLSINARIAHTSYSDALEFCRESLLPENTWGRGGYAWRIVRHEPNKTSIIIAESK